MTHGMKGLHQNHRLTTATGLHWMACKPSATAEKRARSSVIAVASRRCIPLKGPLRWYEEWRELVNKIISFGYMQAPGYRIAHCSCIQNGSDAQQVHSEPQQRKLRTNTSDCRRPHVHSALRNLSHPLRFEWRISSLRMSMTCGVRVSSGSTQALARVDSCPNTHRGSSSSAEPSTAFGHGDQCIDGEHDDAQDVAASSTMYR